MKTRRRRLRPDAGRGASGGIYGAKITGGGASGSVALMCDRGLNPALEGVIGALAARYGKRTGIRATVFSGSSDGANL